MSHFDVSRCMSTQHPDNVSAPFFADHSVIEGDDEIKEAFHAYSHLKIREQLWDCEGKEVDNFVVKKLFTRYPDYFKRHQLGRNQFLLLRVPNPSVEKNEAKMLLEVLESIPRSYDIASLFYGEDIAPIFEVSVPMVSDEMTLIRIYEYYKRFVSGKQNLSLVKGDVPISSWIGKFSPETLRVMPLFETKEAMLSADKIVSKYLSWTKCEDYQRVWFARSDPALNYGSLAAVLIEKIALLRIHRLEEKLSIDLPVMIGVGSAPFRGNFKPTNISNCLQEYPSIQTFTAQSAFKYDYDEDTVKKAVYDLNNTKRKKPLYVDENGLISIIDRTSAQYEKEIRLLAPLINSMARYVPLRRKRKLHTGLFGYSRESCGVCLPRAIKFTASCYSMGIPPELFGLSCLTQNDLSFIREQYPSFDEDMKDALAYLNPDNIKYLPQPIQKSITSAISFFDYEIDNAHKKLTTIIMDDFSNKKESELTENITQAAWIRRFLG